MPSVDGSVVAGDELQEAVTFSAVDIAKTLSASSCRVHASDESVPVERIHSPTLRAHDRGTSCDHTQLLHTPALLLLRSGSAQG